MWPFTSKNKKTEEERRKNEREELNEKIFLIKKKIKEIEYLEFRNKEREVVRKFYEAAKMYCYGYLHDLETKKKGGK